MAIGKEVISNVGLKTTYHRIESVEYDFFNNQIHITVKSYTDKNYRDMEKAQLEDIEAKIARFYELVNKEILKENEKEELSSLEIGELEARKIEDRFIDIKRYSLPLSNDVRENIYKEITAIVPEMADSNIV